MAKQGLDADSDVSSVGDIYLDSQEEDQRSDSSAPLDGEIFWSFNSQYLSLSAAVAVIWPVISHPSPQTLWCLSKDVFEQCTLAGSEAFNMPWCL